MTALEVVLLIVGIVCFAASFFVGNSEENEEKTGESVSESGLTQAEQEMVRRQVEAMIEEQLGDVSERTEAQLDKISNTKILELNEYAETVMGEINRNHNETVFLYDMLNEKAKDVKNTVKDVNTVKRELDRAAAYVEEKKNEKPVNEADLAKTEPAETLSDNMSEKGAVHADDTSKQTESVEASHKDAQSEKTANNNEKIIELFNRGMSNKEMAKELGLGIGEVRLVVDLYNSTR